MWQNTNPDTATGTFTITWTQAGSNLSGTISINNSTCISAATISGHVSNGVITFGAVKGQESVSYSGATSGANTLQGTYAAGSTCGNATGNWAATRK